MRPLKPSLKTALVSMLVVSSTLIGIYAVENIKENNVKDTGNKIKLDIEKIDSDTVRVSLDNIKDIPKALQFSIKLDGDVKLANGQNSIHDLINEEAQRRIKEKTVAQNTNNILTDYAYNESTNTIDVLITSYNSLPKTNDKINVFELDVKKSSILKNSAPSYKVVPANEDEYKYVSANNKEYSGLGVVHDNQTITMNIAPTIKLNKPYIEVVEGETLELTPEKLGIAMEDKDSDENLRLEVKENNKVITTFKKDTPGVYNLECYAIDKYNEKSETLNLQVNVKLEEVTEKPVITIDGKPLQDITINGGDIFKPLENVKAVDAKGRELEVKLSVDKELNLDPEVDTTYNLTYTATDIYSNKTEITITLTVRVNNAPVISGVKDHTLKVGDTFDPREGVKVTDEDKNIELNIDSNVDTSVAGEYKVLYSATDSQGKTTRVQSNVVVKSRPSVTNNAPKISATDKVIKVGDEFDALEGVSAHDKEDGDITKAIKVDESNVDTNKVGSYTVKYSVEDSQGAKSTKTITVTVNPKLSTLNQIPEISASDKVISVGDEFDALEGVSAHDKEDGDITKAIKVDESNVDTNTVGIYTVKYSVEDSQGAKAIKVRNIEVEEIELEKPEPDTDTDTDIPGPGIDTETDETQKPGGNESKPGDGDSNSEDNKLPITGDKGILGFVITGLAAAVCLVGVNYKKKKK